MTTKPHPPVVARVEIISDNPNAGEAYQHTVVVHQNGRVRSVVKCVEQEATTQEWGADRPPTAKELAGLLITACRDEYHECRVRLLSAVVHGLLPQGGHLWDEAVEIPDAVLDAALGFGSRSTYRVELRRALADALRDEPEVSWALRIQEPGTKEHDEFVHQAQEASTGDASWLLRSKDASRRGTGTPFDDLVRWAGQEEFDAENPETWFEVWGEESQACYDPWNGDWSISVFYGRPKPGEVALLEYMPEYEDGFNLLHPESTRKEAKKEARSYVAYWVQHFRASNPDFQISGAEQE